MWLAGMTFGYGLGFLLIIGGVVVGVSLPYVVGSLFYDKIHVRILCFSVSSPYILFTNYSSGNSVLKAYDLLSYAGLVSKISEKGFHDKISR